MDKKLAKEFKEAKENMCKILVGSRMVEICYNETINLIFRQKVNNDCNRMTFSLMIDAPCWFGNKIEWESKMKKATVIGYEDCCLISELVRLRYNNLIYVKAVEFFEEYFQIIFNNEDKLSIAYYSESDYSWVLEEVSQKVEEDRIAIFCQGNELCQNHISECLDLF